jgi:hypothetical protein
MGSGPGMKRSNHMAFHGASWRCRNCLGALLLWASAGLSSPAAVFVVENFNADPTWVDRDSGEMTVAWNSGFGYLGSGSMEGGFAFQGVPSPETDAMRIDSGASGGDYSGNFYTKYAGFDLDDSIFNFMFYSDTVLPSDLRFRIGNGSSTFSRSLTAQATSVGGWQSISVDLSYAGWLGGTGAQYSNLFSGVTFIDIQIARSGEDAHSFFVDDFTLTYDLDDGGGGDPLDAVPEAATTQFLLLGLAFMSKTLRRQARRLMGVSSPGSA